MTSTIQPTWRNHFVPESYLANFVDETGKVCQAATDEVLGADGRQGTSNFGLWAALSAMPWMIRSGVWWCESCGEGVLEGDELRKYGSTAAPFRTWRQRRRGASPCSPSRGCSCSDEGVSVRPFECLNNGVRKRVCTPFDLAPSLTGCAWADCNFYFRDAA